MRAYANFKNLLMIGDMRTIGASNDVVHIVLKYPKSFPEVFGLMRDPNPGVRMRAADAIEKICRQKPQLLKSQMQKLLTQIAPNSQQEVQWHVAQLFSHAKLTRIQMKKAVEILRGYISSTESSIVKVFALQALCDIALKEKRYRKSAIGLIQSEMKKGSKSVINRGQKLLRELSEDATSTT